MAAMIVRSSLTGYLAPLENTSQLSQLAVELSFANTRAVDNIKGM